MGWGAGAGAVSGGGRRAAGWELAASWVWIWVVATQSGRRPSSSGLLHLCTACAYAVPHEETQEKERNQSSQDRSSY